MARRRPTMTRLLTSAALVITLTVLVQPAPRAVARAAEGQQTGAPTIDELISLRRAGSPAISPDGRFVAYTVREANWDDNNYHTEIWLVDAAGGETRLLTSHPKKSSASPAWSPDGSRLAFTT